MSGLRRSARPRAPDPSPSTSAAPSPAGVEATPPPRTSRRSAVRARAALRAPVPPPDDFGDHSPPPDQLAEQAAPSEAEHEPAATEQEQSHDDEELSQAASQSHRRRASSRPKRRAAPLKLARGKRRATGPATPMEGEAEAGADEEVEAEGGEGAGTDAGAGEGEGEEEETDPDDDGGNSRLPADAKGDKKVSVHGVLQGGRQLRCAVLTFPERGEHVFVLARDAARALEYRDANYFGKLNKVLRIVRLSPDEREMLVQLEMIKPHLRGRPIAAVYARDLFQKFGARIVVEGKKVDDDYYEDKALETGSVRGELAFPMSRDRLRDEYRQRVRAAKAQARMAAAEEDDTPGAGDESGSDAADVETSHAAQLREMYEKREREKEREKLRRRIVSSSHTHLSPAGVAVTTVFGDAGADPWTRTGPGAKNTSRKAALHRDGIDEGNWVLRFALAAAAAARTHASAREKARVLLPCPPVEDGRGEADAPLPPERDATADLSASRIEPASDADEQGGPTGVYEPGTNRVHVPASTQATWAQWRRLSPLPRIPGLGPEGDKRLPSLGEVPSLLSRSWGVMSVQTSAVVAPAGEARPHAADVGLERDAST